MTDAENNDADTGNTTHEIRILLREAKVVTRLPGHGRTKK